MSTTGEQVQVTPELLATLEEGAAAMVFRSDRGEGAAVVLALVQRIRELESTVEDWKGAVRSLENVGKPLNPPGLGAPRLFD